MKILEEIQKFISPISISVFEAKEQKICYFCGQKVKIFESEFSINEYQISGFCKNCQIKALKEE